MNDILSGIGIAVGLITLIFVLGLFFGHMLIVTPDAERAIAAIETVRSMLQATPIVGE